MQTPVQKCPVCQLEAPGLVEGVCPKCLLELALANGSDVDEDQDYKSVIATPFTQTRIRYFGDYELIEEIARGGMGVVFKARQMNLNRLVAVKVIHSGAFASEASVKRFKAEAEAAAVLKHPNIIPIYEIGEVQGQHYFSMALIEGVTLKEALRQATFTVEKAAKMVATIARAVHFAHQRRILHRDIKPSNIVVDEKGEPHLTDFGLAKLIERESTITHTEAILGTPSYMAPEQARGDARNVTTAADVYGIGAVLYECLTCNPPFAGGTSAETVRKVLDEEVRPVSYFNDAVDRDLETICLKCLAKEPAKRYASAEALAEDLERWSRGEPVLARRISAAERAAKWVKRRPAEAAVLAASIVALIACAALAISVPAYRNAERARRGEVSARQGEEQQRKAVESALVALQDADYAKNLSLAAREFDANDISAAERILDECPANLRAWEWRYLKRLCYARGQGDMNNSRVLFQGKRLHTVAFDSTSKSVLTQGDDGMKVFETVSGKQLSSDGALTRDARLAESMTNLVVIGVLSGPTIVFNVRDGTRSMIPVESVYGEVALSSDGKMLAVANYTHPEALSPFQLGIWDTSSGKLLRTFREQRECFTAVCFSPDGRLLAAAEGPITIKPHKYGLEPNGEGRRSRMIYVWDVNTGNFLYKLKGHKYAIWKMAFTPDSQRLISASGAYLGGAPGEIKVWDVARGRQLFDLKGGHQNCVFSVAISPDGKRLASAGGVYGHQGDDIVIWDLETRKQVFSLKGHSAAVYDVAFSPDGNYLASASHDGSLRLWSAAPPPPERQIDLSRYFNADLWDLDDLKHSLAELPKGLGRFGEVRFDVERIIQLSSNANTNLFERKSRITMGQRMRKIHFLQATVGYVPDGTPVAAYKMYYADGESVRQEVVYGENIRQWFGEQDAQLGISRGRVAWAGGENNEHRLFEMVWENPRPNIAVMSIQFVSSRSPMERKYRYSCHWPKGSCNNIVMMRLIHAGEFAAWNTRVATVMYTTNPSQIQKIIGSADWRPVMPRDSPNFMAFSTPFHQAHRGFSQSVLVPTTKDPKPMKKIARFTCVLVIVIVFVVIAPVRKRSQSILGLLRSEFHDADEQPIENRKQHLRDLLPRDGPWRLSDFINADLEHSSPSPKRTGLRALWRIDAGRCMSQAQDQEPGRNSKPIRKQIF